MSDPQMIQAGEPTVAALGHSPLRYLVATRPGFLAVSAVPVALGAAAAHFAGASLEAGVVAATGIGALLVHAGVNVLNDFYDDRSGGDALNAERVFPFTGGSRVIQNGVLSGAAMARFGMTLLALGAAIGFALLARGGWPLAALGALGLWLGWAYSAPPFSLAARGLGEPAVAIGFGLLIPVGTWLAQGLPFHALPLIAGGPFALLVAAVLYINQFPDFRADSAVGKRNWVVRLGRKRAVIGYYLLVVLAYGALVTAIALRWLPAAALAAAAPAALHYAAARTLARNYERPQGLVPAIRLTIAGTIVHGALLATALAV
ncbi:MAG: prenyltransferase [Chromatiales bacterium]|nr:prenyltransferase [Chromatiales bacterium]